MIRMTTYPAPYIRITLASLFLLLWVCPLQAVVVDGIAAIVDDEVVLISHISAALAPFYQEYSMKYEGDELRDKLAALRDEILQKAIEDELLLQLGKEMGVQVDDREIDARIKEIKGRFSSEEEFQQALLREGRSFKSFREQIRDQFIIRYVVKSKIGSANITVSDEEIRDYYRDHQADYSQEPMFRIQHIFLKADDEVAGTGEGSRAQAENILAQLQEGMPFEELAAQWSDGPNKEEGGDLGLLRKGEIVPVLEETAFSLEPGEVSDVIQTEGGFYILKLVEKRLGMVISVDEVKDDIEDLLVEQKSAEVYSRWIQELEEQAYIEVKLKGPIM